MKKIVVTLLILLYMVTTACQNNSDEEIVIGWIGPLAGPSAVLGIDSVVAAQIAVDEINSQGGIKGQRIKLLIEDDQYNSKQTLAAYNKLVYANKAKILLVNTYSGVFSLAEQAKQDGVVLIDPLDCNTDISSLGSHIFCLATDSESIAEVLAQDANKKYEKVSVIYFNSDRFMPLVKDTFVEEFDGEVKTYAYSASSKDFKTILNKIIVEDGSQAIVLLGYDETGIMMKQSRELGFLGQFYTTGTVTSPNLQELAQGHAQDTLFAFWSVENNPSTQRFNTEFEKRQLRMPILDLATYPTYDAVKSIAIALEDDSRKSFEERLLNSQPFNGLTGKVAYEPDGAIRIQEELFILKDGRPVAMG